MKKTYKFDKCKLEVAFLVLKPSKKFIGKSNLVRMTEISGACDRFDFDGKTILLVGSDDNETITLLKVRML